MSLPLPSEMILLLKSYAEDNEVFGMTTWEFISNALPPETEYMHEYICQVIFNELDMNNRPNTFDILQDDCETIKVTSANFIPILDLAMGSDELSLWERVDDSVIMNIDEGSYHCLRDGKVIVEDIV